MIPVPAVPLANVIDLLLDTVCVVDAGGRFVFVSAACERVFGYTAEEMVGQAMLDFVHPDDRLRTLQAAGEIMSGRPKPNFENRYLRKDGQVVHIMWSARWSEDDRLRIAVAHDITERKRAESVQAALYAISEAAHAAQDLLALFQQIHQIIGGLLPASNFFVALYDQKNDELSFPYHVDERDPVPASRRLDSGTLIAEVIRYGQPLLLTPDTLSTLPVHLRSPTGSNALFWLGVPLDSNKGTIGALVLQSYSEDTPYSERDKELLQFVSTQVASAIERKQMQGHLQHIARHDRLTNLPNRDLLCDRLGTALARARREQDGLCLLYLDVDNFKQVNDSFGHAAGDLLLQVLAQRLKECLRETDTVARVGGDEFVVLLERIQEPRHAVAVAEKVRAALDQPFELAGHKLRILPSIGIALYPQDGDEEGHLLRQADAAMYAAKRNGGNQVCRAASEPLDAGIADPVSPKIP